MDDCAAKIFTKESLYQKVGKNVLFPWVKREVVGLKHIAIHQTALIITSVEQADGQQAGVSSLRIPTTVRAFLGWLPRKVPSTLLEHDKPPYSPVVGLVFAPTRPGTRALGPRKVLVVRVLSLSRLLGFRAGASLQYDALGLPLRLARGRSCPELHAPRFFLKCFPSFSKKRRNRTKHKEGQGLLVNLCWLLKRNDKDTKRRIEQLVWCKLRLDSIRYFHFQGSSQKSVGEHIWWFWIEYTRTRNPLKV